MNSFERRILKLEEKAGLQDIPPALIFWDGESDEEIQKAIDECGHPDPWVRRIVWVGV